MEFISNKFSPDDINELKDRFDQPNYSDQVRNNENPRPYFLMLN